MSSLDNIRIAKPCPASWAEMQGDDKMRYCTGCKQRVFNLSAMTRAEAEQLLADRSGRMCLRIYRRADGRLMTKDCPVGVTKTRRRRAVMFVALGAFFVNLASAAGLRVPSFSSDMGEMDVSTVGCETGKVMVPPAPDKNDVSFEKSKPNGGKSDKRR